MHLHNAKSTGQPNLVSDRPGLHCTKPHLRRPAQLVHRLVSLFRVDPRPLTQVPINAKHPTLHRIACPIWRFQRAPNCTCAAVHDVRANHLCRQIRVRQELVGARGIGGGSETRPEASQLSPIGNAPASVVRLAALAAISTTVSGYCREFMPPEAKGKGPQQLPRPR